MNELPRTANRCAAPVANACKAIEPPPSQKIRGVRGFTHSEVTMVFAEVSALFVVFV